VTSTLQKRPALKAKMSQGQAGETALKTWNPRINKSEATSSSLAAPTVHVANP